MKKVSVILLFSAISAACWSAERRSSRSETYSSNSANSNNSTKETEARASTANSMKPETKEPDMKAKIGFLANLPDGFEQPNDDISRLLLREYGAVFVARGGAVPPKNVVFRDSSSVGTFQSSVAVKRAKIGAFDLELQKAAMEALEAAVAEASAKGASITPREADSARRTYDETVSLWKSRVDPALDHWSGNGKIAKDEAAKISTMSPYEQVSAVLALEKKGIFFAKDLKKSIIYSVAPPGTSQHLAMLAFDCAEYSKSEVRSILATHGWFQTVVSDLPHFTFLGVKENDLPALGLKRVSSGEQVFWVPDVN